MNVERELAAWAAGLRWDDVPARTQTFVEDVLLDTVASAVAGRQQQLVARVSPVALSYGADSAAAATFLYAYAITAATLCDVYRPGLCHVTPVVVPTLAALLEESPATREELLVALTVGLEVTTRLCRFLPYASLRARGWHSPGVLGPIGAAAAGARLLSLGEDGMASALAHGAAQSAGTFAGLGTEAVKFNQARGACSGLLATLMAREGLAAAPRWLAAEDGGLARAYAGETASDAVLAGLGADWELEQISLRRWPAASSVQSLIEACLSLEQQADAVQHVAVELSPAAYKVSGPRGWADPLSAQQSARWVVAAILSDHDWWFEQWSTERIRDVSVGAFAAEQVTTTVNTSLDDAAVRLAVHLGGGRAITKAIDSALGDPGRSLSRADIVEKLRRALTSEGSDRELPTILELLDQPTTDSIYGFRRTTEAVR